MDIKKKDPDQTGSNGPVSPSLVRSPNLIRYNTSPDIHRRAMMGLSGSQGSPSAQHQLYGHSFRNRISSLSSSSSPQFNHPLAGSPNSHQRNNSNTHVPASSTFPSISPQHIRTDTEMDWLYDRNAELELEVDKLARQVKVQNMVARNEGRRASAKIDALEAALLDMERQNAKLVAEGKRARIREKRQGGTGAELGVGLGLGGGDGQGWMRGPTALVEENVSIRVGRSSEGSGRRSYRSPSPEVGPRSTLLPRRRSIGADGRDLAAELGLNDVPAGPVMVEGYGNTGTPPVNDIPLVEIPQDGSSQGSASPSLPPRTRQQTLSPEQVPSQIRSDISGLPRRSPSYLAPSPAEGMPQRSPHSPNSFPSSRLGVRNRSRLFPPSAGSPTPKFQVWASPGSPFRSPGSTIGIASRFSGGRKTLASELASWAMDMEDETMDEQESETILHEAGGGNRDEDWKTTRLGRYSLLEKNDTAYLASPEHDEGRRNEPTTAQDEPSPSGSWFGRIFQRMKRFYQSTWLEIQFIWVVLIFLRRVWIEGRQGLVLRSRLKDKKKA